MSETASGLFPTAVENPLNQDENVVLNKNSAKISPRIEKLAETFVETAMEESKQESEASSSIQVEESQQISQSCSQDLLESDRKPQEETYKAYSETKQNISFSERRQTRSTSAPAKHHLTYSQELKQFPADVINNPHVAKRLNLFPLTQTRPPRASRPNTLLKTRQVPPIDEYTQALLEDKIIEEEPSVEQLHSSYKQLKALERDLIEKGDYMAAKKASRKFDFVSNKLESIKVFNGSKQDIEAIVSKRNELKAYADAVKEMWNQRIAEYKRTTDAKAQSIRSNNEEELSKFDEAIPNELTPLFNRNSVTYLEMKSKEQYLAFNKYFDEAHELQRKANKLYTQEMENNYESMDTYYREKRKRLKKQQNKALQNFLDYSQSRIAEMTAKRDGAIAGALARVEILDNQVYKMCEERGIKPKSIDFSVIDRSRVEKLIARDKEDFLFGQSSLKSKSRTATPDKSN